MKRDSLVVWRLSLCTAGDVGSTPCHMAWPQNTNIRKHFLKRKGWSIETGPNVFQRLELTDRNFKITFINMLTCSAEKLSTEHKRISRKNSTMQKTNDNSRTKKYNSKNKSRFIFLKAESTIQKKRPIGKKKDL